MSIINQEIALARLNSGFPIAFQTDTVPAIGCLPEFSEVIYEIKKRDRNKPLILMAADNYQLKEFVKEAAVEDFEYIASKYWPGALTMVIPISDKKKSFLTSTNFSIGVRIPNSLMAKSLIEETGPLLTSSANLSGMPVSTTAERISVELPKVDILGPVPWDKCSGRSSTIISWVNYRKWKLIREGQLSISEAY